VTKKDIKNMIKQKAMAVEVKDFSQDILEKFQSQPKPLKETIQEPKRSFKLKPILISLTLVMSIFLIVILFPKEEQSVVDTPLLENIEDVIALSSIQSTSLIPLLESELSMNEGILLRFGPVERNNRIRDEIEDVSKYLETIEKLYANKDDFKVTDERQNAQGFSRRMRFASKDLLNEETSYEIRYNQRLNQKTKQFVIEGLLYRGDKAYQMTLEGKQGEKHVEMITKKDDHNYIRVNYEVDENKHIYEVQIIKQDHITQMVEIELKQIDETRYATLSFIEGESTGNYQFELRLENSIKVIHVDYEIQIDDEVESGEMTFRINTDQTPPVYQITVQPEGRTPFIVTRGRFQQNG